MALTNLRTFEERAVKGVGLTRVDTRQGLILALVRYITSNPQLSFFRSQGAMHGLASALVISKSDTALANVSRPERARNKEGGGSAASDKGAVSMASESLPFIGEMHAALKASTLLVEQHAMSWFVRLGSNQVQAALSRCSPYVKGSTHKHHGFAGVAKGMLPKFDDLTFLHSTDAWPLAYIRLRYPSSAAVASPADPFFRRVGAPMGAEDLEAAYSAYGMPNGDDNRLAHAMGLLAGGSDLVTAEQALNLGSIDVTARDKDGNSKLYNPEDPQSAYLLNIFDAIAHITLLWGIGPMCAARMLADPVSYGIRELATTKDWERREQAESASIVLILRVFAFLKLVGMARVCIAFLANPVVRAALTTSATEEGMKEYDAAAAALTSLPLPPIMAQGLRILNAVPGADTPAWGSLDVYPIDFESARINGTVPLLSTAALDKAEMEGSLATTDPMFYDLRRSFRDITTAPARARDFVIRLHRSNYFNDDAPLSQTHKRVAAVLGWMAVPGEPAFGRDAFGSKVLMVTPTHSERTFRDCFDHAGSKVIPASLVWGEVKTASIAVCPPEAGIDLIPNKGTGPELMMDMRNLHLQPILWLRDRSDDAPEVTADVVDPTSWWPLTRQGMGGSYAMAGPDTRMTTNDVHTWASMAGLDVKEFMNILKHPITGKRWYHLLAADGTPTAAHAVTSDSLKMLREHISASVPLLYRGRIALVEKDRLRDVGDPGLDRFAITNMKPDVVIPNDSLSRNDLASLRVTPPQGV